MLLVGNQRGYILSILSHYMQELKSFANKNMCKRRQFSCSYRTKIINAYIVYYLYDWPEVSFRNFTLKNYLFRATNIIKNNDKEKYVYSGYGTAYDAKGKWSFGNDYARNIVIFGVVNSSSSHADNPKNDLIILGNGPTFGINGRFDTSEKKLILILVKQWQNFP